MTSSVIDLDEMERRARRSCETDTPVLYWASADILALVRAVRAAEPFACDSEGCACNGPIESSLPGECGCDTRAREDREALREALAPFTKP